MKKMRKSSILTIRMLPAEKQAAVELANRLGLNITDIVRLSLNETLNKAHGVASILDISDVIKNQVEQKTEAKEGSHGK